MNITSDFWFWSTIALIVVGVGFILLQKSSFDLGILDTIERFRNVFSTYVFSIAVLGIGILIYIGVGPTTANGKEYTTPREAFLALLPVFTTWVGTILAHYFSRENFESAARVAEHSTSVQTSQKKLVKDAIKIRPPDKFTKLKTPDEKQAADISLQAVNEALRPDNIDRMVVLLDNNLVLYVIHEDILNKFIKNEFAGKTIDLSSKKLSDLLSSKIGSEAGKSILENFSFVSEESTLDDARRNLTQKPGLRDVFVTRNGRKDQPVLGWLTDLDLR